MKKKHRVFLSLIFFITTIISWLPTAAFAATGKDVSANITALNVSPSTVYNNDRFEVNFTFDDSTLPIEEGDFINIEWPTTGEVYAQGFARTIPLSIDGVEVASLVIDLDHAQVVFNANIETKTDIQGGGRFEVQARNVSTDPAGSTGSIQIQGGGKSADLTVIKAAVGQDPFYYKTGDIQPDAPNRVRWFLSTNNNEAAVDGPITIEDQIGPGQRLDPTTFEIYVKQGTSEMVYYDVDGVQQFLADYPGAVLNYSVATNQLSIFLPENVAMNRLIRVHYRTNIENSSQATFENASTASYAETGQPPVVNQPFNSSVKNLDASGNISGTEKGELKIVKLIEGTEVALAGVQFELKRVDGGLIQNQPTITLVTDANGIAGIKNLTVGTYEITEVSAPDWIDFNPATAFSQQFTISATDTEGVKLTLYNPKKMTEVTATKTWQGGISPRPTTYFKLYRAVANGAKELVPNAPIQTLVDGVTSVTWTGLEKFDNTGQEYAFSVQEVDQAGTDAVPAGYSKVESGLNVTNTNIEKVNIAGQKTWEDNNNQAGKRPNSITVNLLADGKVLKTQVVTAADNWRYQFTDLPKYAANEAIVYTISEEAVPAYTPTVNGFDLTNRYTPDLTSVTATKTWQGGISPRPTTYFKLYRAVANGAKEQVPNAPIQKLEDGVTSVTWTGLEKFDNTGQEYAFSVQEVDQAGTDAVPAGYSKVESGLNVTNTNIEKVNIAGQVTWNDQNDKDKKRPNEVTVNLLADGKVLKTQVVTAADDWRYEFADLPKYEANKAIVYSVSEEKVTGYSTKITDWTITNTYLAPVDNEQPKPGENPGNPTPPSTSTPPSQVSTGNQQESVVSSEEMMDKASVGAAMILPETNDRNNNWILLLGTLLIGLSGWFVYKKKMK